MARGILYNLNYCRHIGDYGWMWCWMTAWRFLHLRFTHEILWNSLAVAHSMAAHGTDVSTVTGPGAPKSCWTSKVPGTSTCGIEEVGLGTLDDLGAHLSLIFTMPIYATVLQSLLFISIPSCSPWLQENSRFSIWYSTWARHSMHIILEVKWWDHDCVKS